MASSSHVKNDASTPAPVAATGVRRSVLPGGVRVVTEHVPGVRSAAVGVWVGVGSRDEQPSVAGAAHFLEHLLFKATPTRTALDIAETMDGIGGELNAFTSKEHTCFYAHVLDDDLPIAVASENRHLSVPTNDGRHAETTHDGSSPIAPAPTFVTNLRFEPTACVGATTHRPTSRPTHSPAQPRAPPANT